MALNASPERIKLIELSQFVLNTDIENIRSELYGYLVAHTLYHKQPEGLSVVEIKEALRELYGLDVDKGLISNSLQRLQSSNAIIPFRNNEFILSEEAMRRISSHNEEYLKLRDQITEQFLSKIKENFPALSQSEAENASGFLFTTLFSIFERYGSLCSSMIAGKRPPQEDLTTLPDFQSVCITNVRKLENPVLRKIVKNVFFDYLNNPTPEFARFLFSLAQSYTIAQIMNLDPTLQALEAKRLSERKLYLDTNILVSLITAQEAELVRGVVNYSRSLGVKMVYTPTTVKEYNLLLTQSKILFNKVPLQKDSTIGKVEPLMVDPFVKSFWRETKTNKMLAWKGFLVKMEGLEEILSSNYNITAETPYIDIDKNDPEFTKMFAACATANYLKSDSALTHDAYHLILIQRLREKENLDELGFRSYFLTRDSSLDLAESFVYRDEKICSSVHVGLWLQMISPFLSPKMGDGDAANIYTIAWFSISILNEVN